MCEDASCLTEPRVVFEADGGVLPVTTEGPDGGFFVWYVTGASGLPAELATGEVMEQGYAAVPAAYADYSDVMVAACDSDGCGEPQYVQPGEDWVAPFRGNLRLFTSDSGNLGGFFHHASLNEPTPQLHLISCENPECSSGDTHALGIAADEWHYRAFDVITSPGTPPKVVYAANGELHLYTCPNETCTTP